MADLKLSSLVFRQQLFKCLSVRQTEIRLVSFVRLVYIMFLYNAAIFTETKKTQTKHWHLTAGWIFCFEYFRQIPNLQPELLRGIDGHSKQPQSLATDLLLLLMTCTIFPLTSTTANCKKNSLAAHSVRGIDRGLSANENNHKKTICKHYYSIIITVLLFIWASFGKYWQPQFYLWFFFRLFSEVTAIYSHCLSPEIFVFTT